MALPLLATAVYAPVRGFGFVNVDDSEYVFQNPLVLRGLTASGVAEAFTTFRASNWHPLTWLSHMLDVTLFGVAPGAHHAVNVLLHAACAALLFAFLRRATGALRRSAFVAALFAVHPLHVESVAWIAERKDLLCALFFLAGLHAYASWVARPRAAAYAAVAAMLALALLSKPMAVTFPFVLLLLDRWPFERRGGAALVVEKLPLFALSAFSVALTWHAQSGRAMAGVSGIGIVPRLENALVSCGAYLVQTAWPVDLAALYPHPALAGLEIPRWQLAAAGLAVAGLSALAVRERARQSALLVGWLWYLGMLVPVIGLVQVGVQGRADRYTYLPLVGVFVALVWGAAAVVERWPRARPAAIAASVAVLLALAVVARAQVATWRDAETVNRHALAHTERNWVAWQGLGDALWRAGRGREAAEAFEAALRIRPDDAQAWNGLGVLYGSEGRPDLALAPLQQAVRLDPADADAWYNLGTALGQLERPAEAVRCFRTAVQLLPDHAGAWFNLGLASLASGDRAGAAEAERRLAGLDPQRAQALRRVAGDVSDAGAAGAR